MCTDKLCQRFVCHRLARVLQGRIVRVLPSRQRLGKLESQNHLSSKMWTEFFPLIGIMLSISLSRSFLVLLLATIVSPAAANQKRELHAKPDQNKPASD